LRAFGAVREEISAPSRNTSTRGCTFVVRFCTPNVIVSSGFDARSARSDYEKNAPARDIAARGAGPGAWQIVDDRRRHANC